MPKGKRKTMNGKVLLAGIGGFVLGAFVLGLAMFLVAPSMMIVEDVSPMGYEETVQAINDAAAAHGWKVPAVHTIDASVKAAGYDVAPVSVIELCQPDHAGKILEDDAARVVTSMMPCRVSVYQTSDGQVVISRMNTGLVSKLFGGLVAEVMAQATADNEQILSAVLP
jgi:uncharacterized protein (DUF302 family)